LCRVSEGFQHIEISLLGENALKNVCNNVVQVGLSECSVVEAMPAYVWVEEHCHNEDILISSLPLFLETG
jgi:hypothetical protein